MSDSPVVAADAARAKARPPRDNLVRAARVGGSLRATAPAPAAEAPSENANGMPTLYGYFTRYGEWTEIDSWYEGQFMENLAAGAFKKTFREQTPKVLFQHGMDGMCGDKPLGAPEVLRDDAEGPYYEVPLLDTSYVHDLVPGLEANLYGASFRFSVMREDWVEEPGVSDYNPKGLPERTIKEVRCSEFGPVTFPAYPGATAAVRSMTDEWIAARMTTQPESQVRAVLAYLEQRDSRPGREAVPAGEGAAETRMDSEDVGLLAEMLEKASEYIEEQDEMTAEEAAAVMKMQGVQATLIELMNVEAAEVEPADEPEDEENSVKPAGATRDTKQEPPAKATAPVQNEAAAPERSSTPLYTGQRDALAAPGSPTPLYIGTDTRKEWEI